MITNKELNELNDKWTSIVYQGQKLLVKTLNGLITYLNKIYDK